jgi:uncharacterized glyoxalase superfamily protein PhnB
VPDARPVLDQLNIVVRDMEVSAAFYRAIGVEFADIPAEWADWAAHHRNAVSHDGVDLDLDSREFACQWDRGWPEGRTGVVIGFRVATRDEVDRLYGELVDGGHPGQQEPYDAFWGARFAVVSDPDGNSVALMSPADPGRRSDPPAPPS